MEPVKTDPNLYAFKSCCTPWASLVGMLRGFMGIMAGLQDCTAWQGLFTDFTFDLGLRGFGVVGFGFAGAGLESSERLLHELSTSSLLIVSHSFLVIIWV